jgi:hypothetical protein
MLDCGYGICWELGTCSAREKRFTGFGRPRSRHRERQLVRLPHATLQYVNWAKCTTLVRIPVECGLSLLLPAVHAAVPREETGTG